MPNDEGPRARAATARYAMLSTEPKPAIPRPTRCSSPCVENGAPFVGSHHSARSESETVCAGQPRSACHYMLQLALKLPPPSPQHLGDGKERIQ